MAPVSDDTCDWHGLCDNGSDIAYDSGFAGRHVGGYGYRCSDRACGRTSAAGGDWRDAAGGYRGEAIGSFVGSVGGTVLGAAAASSQNQRDRNTASAREYQVPYLVIEDIYLEDRNNNQIVDAGESCRISFILSNEGRQTAYNIEPVIKVEQGGKYVKLSKPLVIRQLPPHKRVSYTVTLHASPKLKAGEIVLSVRLKSSDGYLTDKETFTLPAGRY